MASDFECPACRLGFSVGTYYPHIIIDDIFGHRLLVCSQCGCQHRVDIPAHDSERTPVLWSQPDLIFDCPKRERSQKLLIKF